MEDDGVSVGGDNRVIDRMRRDHCRGRLYIRAQ